MGFLGLSEVQRSECPEHEGVWTCLWKQSLPWFFWDATEWAPYAEPAVPGGTREERREERRRVKVRALDLALKHGTWMCRRCGVENKACSC